VSLEVAEAPSEPLRKAIWAPVFAGAKYGLRRTS